MQSVVQRFLSLLAILMATVTIGCGSNEPNPDLKAPDVPPSTRGPAKGALKSDLKAPNADAKEKSPEEKK